jgi:hypothetical protein
MLYVLIGTKSIFKIKYRSSEFQFGISVIIFSYVTIICFLKSQICYMIQNAKWADEWNVHKLNLINTLCLKCPQQWTNTEQNVPCLMLTLIASQTTIRAVVLTSVSVADSKLATYVRIWYAKRSSRFRLNWSQHNMKKILCTMLEICQTTQNPQRKRRTDLQISVPIGRN